MQDGYANGNTNGRHAAPVTLLLVEADDGRAERMERRLAGACPDLVATRCGSLASARAYLSGTAFDAVCTAEELPDGLGISLVELRDALGLRAPVFVWSRTGSRRSRAPAEGLSVTGAACFVLHGEDDEAAVALGQMLWKRGPEVREPELFSAFRGGSRPEEASGLLEALRTETGAVAHAINNPLTVIAGNAQFLGELARMGGLDPALARSVEDIEAAAHQLNEALARLSALRQRIAASLGVSDRL